MSFKQVWIGVGLGVVVTGCLYVGVPAAKSFMPTNEPEKSSVCSVIASEADAGRLITRLFKDAKIKSYDKLELSPGGTTCLLEVDLTVAGNSGFMYILPNGEQLLNGPMLDKRSKVEVPTAEQVQQYEELKKGPPQVLPALSSSSGRAPLLQAQSAQAPDPSVESDQPVSPGNPKFTTPLQVFDALKSLPALVTDGPGQPVYVLLDPLCTHCQSLYKSSADLSKKYGIQWHWIPIFTNTSGHAMAALVMKVAEKNKAEGLALLSEMMMSDQFDVPKYADQFRALKAEDYERPQKNAVTFLDIFKSSAKAAGTPYVAFQIPGTGQVEVISGEPLESDLLPLLGGAGQL